MSADRYTARVVSDFNAANLCSALAHDEDAPRIEPAAGAYGQWVQDLLADGPGSEADLAVVWTRPEAVAPSFQRLVDGEPARLEEILGEVDAFVELVRRLEGRVRFCLVATWVTPHPGRTFATLGMKPEGGIDYALLRMNLRLAEGLADAPGFHVLDAARWLAAAGREARAPKLWYMAKTPYGHRVFREAAVAIKAALRGIAGRSRKLLVLDLDDTLWGGVVGDVGWENLRLGGHDPVGEAFADFQRALVTLSRRGVLLGIVSKNEEAVALEAIRRHPEMVLREDDFAGWRISWNDKAQSVAELVAELGLGLDAAVFVDDNPVERARVREALPMVAVPDWPEDRTRYREALLALPWFDQPTLSSEDRDRPRMMASERLRRSHQATFESLEDWLSTLDMRVACEPLDASNLPRAAQLLNKTNQFNLATRRLTADELSAWAGEPGRRVLAFRVSDKFGDSGLAGLVGLEARDGRAHLVDFLLSCRVMGRGVEDAMVASAVAWAREQGLPELVARFVPTPRNAPCRAFLDSSPLAPGPDDDTWVWRCDADYPVPSHLKTA